MNAKIIFKALESVAESDRECGGEMEGFAIKVERRIQMNKY